MANYNINAVTRRVVYSGSAGLGPYAFSFEILVQTDVDVYFNATLLTLSTDYTVTINANGTGSITIVTGTNVPSTPTASDQIAIVGARDIERTTDFVTAGELRAAALNEQLDGLTIFDQQLLELTDRAITAPITDPISINMTLPAKDARKGKYLAFNETTGDPEAGATIADVATLASITDDIATLADIEDGTDATDAIQTVAGISANVSTVAGISSNVSTVATNTSNINTVAGISSDVTAVAADSADIQAVADIATQIATVGSNSTNINTVATNISNVNTVAGVSGNVTIVAGISGNVTTVAGISSDVTAVAADATDIGTVAAGIANVNTVGGNMANVNTVAGISGNVTTVANNTTNINAVAADATDIGTVAGSITNVNNVGGSISDVNTVASNLSSVQNFANVYRVGATDPTTSLDTGDLFFNTTSSALKVYDGIAWTAGVTAGSGFLPTTGGGLTGDVTFGDNNKAIFGAGSDLQIYHDGSNSYISEQGTGNLFIDAANYLTLRNTNGESYVAAQANGYVQLFYNGSQKLATTSTGIDVTGTVTADGLTVDGASSLNANITQTAISPSFYMMDSNTTDLNDRFVNAGGTIFLQTVNDAKNTFKSRISANNSTGDIAFYDSTGTSQNLFWDASASRLGIGTTSPDALLEIESSSGGTNLSINNIGTSGRQYILQSTSSASSIGGGKFAIYDGDASSHRFVMDSSGNVGINTNTPSSYTANGNNLVVADVNVGITLASTSASGSGALYFADGTTGSEAYRGIINYLHTNDAMGFHTGAAERMRLDSSGNAIVGSTSSDPVNDGIRLKPAGQVTSTINADVALLLNRRVSDGTIAQFRQDNAVVGSIGSLTSGRDLHVNSTGGILTFESNFNSTERQVVFGDTYLGPRAADNNAVDLGRSVSQFKDLYLSGGVFLGGTGSANKLSDVEEGSWTPSVGGNATYNAQTGKYIKIGNQVTCWFNIYVNSLGTGSHVTVTGLPFTVSNITEFNANGNSMTYWSNINTACTYLAVKLDKNTTQFQFTNTTAATTTVGTSVSVYKDGADTYGTFTYRTG